MSFNSSNLFIVIITFVKVWLILIAWIYPSFVEIARILFNLIAFLVFFNQKCRPWILDIFDICFSHWNICFIMAGCNCYLGGRVVYKTNAFCEAYLFSIEADQHCHFSWYYLFKWSNDDFSYKMVILHFPIWGFTEHTSDSGYWFLVCIH